jgi:Leucine-rich repeat (LRR) protein
VISCSSAQGLDNETVKKIEEAKTNNELKIQNNNQFSEIPDAIFKLDNLKSLSFSGSECDVKPCTNITKLPAKIEKLKNLNQLSLVMNNLKALPSEINSLHLISLDLSNNYDIDVSNLYIPSLEVLNLNDCNLKGLPSNIFKMVNLKVIGIEGNTSVSQKEIDLLKEKLPHCTIYWK